MSAEDFFRSQLNCSRFVDKREAVLRQYMVVTAPSEMVEENFGGIRVMQYTSGGKDGIYCGMHLNAGILTVEERFGVELF